jgi:hypothetical protein
MDTYLLALGWWNFVGSILMIGFFNQPFGRKIFNEWTKIFSTDFVLDYWGKFWMMWAIGLNIFFALINILAVKWGYVELKSFLVWFDVIVYVLFVGLAIWGIRAKRTGEGIYFAFVIFGLWIVWGLVSVL